MNATNVIRQKMYNSWFNWVHLSDDGGGAVCGKELADETRIESRAGIELQYICKSCLQAELCYKVKTVQSGQVRRYGPSHYIYEVTDLREEKRDRDEVLVDCRRVVKRARLKDPKKHFGPWVKELKRIDDDTWRYFVFEASTH